MKTPLVFHDRRSSAARVAKCPSAPLPVFFSLFLTSGFSLASCQAKKSTFCWVTRADISAPPGRRAAQKMNACAKTSLHTCCPGGGFGRWARDDPRRGVCWPSLFVACCEQALRIPWFSCIFFCRCRQFVETNRRTACKFELKSGSDEGRDVVSIS